VAKGAKLALLFQGIPPYQAVISLQL